MSKTWNASSMSCFEYGITARGTKPSLDASGPFGSCNFLKLVKMKREQGAPTHAAALASGARARDLYGTPSRALGWCDSAPGAASGTGLACSVRPPAPCRPRPTERARRNGITRDLDPRCLGTPRVSERGRASEAGLPSFLPTYSYSKKRLPALCPLFGAPPDPGERGEGEPPSRCPGSTS